MSFCKINMNSTVNVLLLSIILVSCNVSPGVYSNAECYNVKMSKDSLIKEVKLFKEKNAEFNLPEGVKFEEGITDFTGLYYFYFYFEDVNVILLSWIRENTFESSTFAIVSIQDCKGCMWKDVNDDLSKNENEFYKEVFENRILSKVSSNWEKR